MRSNINDEVLLFDLRKLRRRYMEQDARAQAARDSHLAHFNAGCAQGVLDAIRQMMEPWEQEEHIAMGEEAVPQMKAAKFANPDVGRRL